MSLSGTSFSIDVTINKLKVLEEPKEAKDVVRKEDVEALFEEVVLSFNSRQGDVILTSSDVTNALVYTPVNKAGDTITGNLILSNNLNLSYLNGSRVLILDASKNVSMATYGPSSMSWAFAQRDASGVCEFTGLTISGVDGSRVLVTDALKNITTLTFGSSSTANSIVQRSALGYSEFVGLTLSGLTASKFVKTDATKTLVSSDITSGDVTTALTFTPLKNTSDTLTGNLEITQDLKLTSVGPINSYIGIDGDHLIQTMADPVITFNTRSGAVSLTSGDVTTALTYTPMNVTALTIAQSDSWSPTVSTANDFTYSSISGGYRRVGNTVYVSLVVVITSSVIDGYVDISLPVSIANSSPALWLVQGTLFSEWDLWGHVYPSTNAGYLYARIKVFKATAVDVTTCASFTVVI